MHKLTQRPWLLLLLPFALSLLFIRDHMTLFSEDGAACLLLAKSLWSGTGYRSIWAEGSPLHAHFPPLLPLMLTPMRGAFGDHLWPVHFFMALWYVLGAWIGYRLLCRYMSAGTAALWITFLVTTPLYPERAAEANSEFPYIVFSLAGLLLLEKRAGATHAQPFQTSDQQEAAPDGFDNISLKRWATSLLLFALAFYMRTIGFVLFLSAALFVLVEAPGLAGVRVPLRARLLKAAAVMVVGVLLMAPWGLWTRDAPSGETYTGVMFIKDPDAVQPVNAGVAELAHRLAGNLMFYAGETVCYLTFAMGQVRKRSLALFLMGAVPLLCVILIGWWRWAMSRKSAVPIYLVLYLGTILLWFWQYPRFLVPVIILSGICLAIGLVCLGEKIWGGNARGRMETALACTAAILILVNLAGIVRHLRQPVPPAITNFYRIHEALKAASSPNDIVVTFNPAITSLLTGLKTRGSASQLSEWTLLKTIDGAKWIVIGELNKEARDIVLTVVERHPDRFRLVRNEGETLLYRIMKL